MSFASALVGLTLLLTLAAFFLTTAYAGPGFLIYVAMLGPAAGWLLPAHAALALPFGLFGAALLAGAGPRTPERVRPERPAAFELPQLVAQRSEPPVRAELGRRLQPPVATLFLGLLAAGIIASPLTWRARTALIVTIVLFVFQVTRWLNAWS